jgi:putative ABC transport system permease protein
MALGNRPGAVQSLVLTENVLLALCGATLGVVVGMIVAAAITAVGIPMPPPPNANRGYIAHIRVFLPTVLAAFSVGFVATVLAAIVPAWRVSRIQVVEALRQNV